MTNSHQYAFEAARLVDDCIHHLQYVATLDTRRNHSKILYELKESLLGVEKLLEDYFFQLVQKESSEEEGSNEVLELVQGENSSIPPISASIRALRSILDRRKAIMEQSPGQPPSPRRPCRTKKSTAERHRSHNPTMTVAIDLSSKTQLLQGYSAARSATDALLFRLIVALQLCLVRIDDAMFVIDGHRRSGGNRIMGKTPLGRKVRSWMVSLGFCGGVFGATAYLLRDSRAKGGGINDSQTVAVTFAEVGVSAFFVAEVAKKWKSLWMTSKLENTMAEIEEWREQWRLVNCEMRGDCQDYSAASTQPPSQRLIEYDLRHNQNKTSSFWSSQGGLHFLMVRNAMDVFYAVQPSNWHIQATAAAAETSLTGTEDQSDKLLISSYLRELIQNSWRRRRDSIQPLSTIDESESESEECGDEEPEQVEVLQAGETANCQGTPCDVESTH